MTRDGRPATGEIQARLVPPTQRWAEGKSEFGVGPKGSRREPKDPSRTKELARVRVV